MFSCISCNKSSTGQMMTSEAAINLLLLRSLHAANTVGPAVGKGLAIPTMRNHKDSTQLAGSC